MFGTMEIGFSKYSITDCFRELGDIQYLIRFHFAYKVKWKIEKMPLF